MKSFLRIFATIIFAITGVFSGTTPAVPPEPIAYTENEPADSTYIYDRIDGADGAHFYIGRPDESKLTQVNASDFGLSTDNADNTAAINAALAYCAEHSGTKLVLNSGVYRFTGDETIKFFGCTNLLVEGNQAKFIFTSTNAYNKMTFYGSRYVEIRNLDVDWDWENDRIGSIARVIAANPKAHTLDLEFPEPAEVDTNIRISAMTQCDPETLTMGAYGSSKEMYFYQVPYSLVNIEKLSDNVLRVTHNGCVDSFEQGEVYMLRHHVYDSTIFRLEGESSNLTFNRINIYGGSGMAFTVGGNASRFQIKNVFIGVDPEFASTRHISLGADAIHIADSNGFFCVEGCDISGMGDDAINVHDNIGYITEIVNANTVKGDLKCRARVGDTICFKDADFNELNFSAVITAVETADGITQLTFDRDVAEKTGVNYIVYSGECNSGHYVIRNNYFHSNRARGLLLQSSDGLCENNRFYKIQGQAIKVIMDILRGYWLEGTGVDNLVIRSNTFEDCNVSGWGNVICLQATYDNSVLKCAAFTNIEITDNTFIDCNEYILDANCTNSLNFSRNKTVTTRKGIKNGKILIQKLNYNTYVKDNTICRNGSDGNKNIPTVKGLRTWADTVLTSNP